MRELPSTLLVAQKEVSTTPYVKIEAVNMINGVTRLNWARLYDGSEDDYYHDVTMPGDGSLIRVRVTPPADSLKLYRQRISNPGPESNFSQWVYTGQYNATVVTAAAQGAEVSIFWIKTNREIRRIKSSDYGVTWDSPELVDYSPTTAIYGLASAYKANGDLAIFFADQSTLYVKKNINGAWQAKTAWDKTTGDLSGVSVIYDGDWNLMVTGKTTSGDFRLWSLVHGDGGDIPVGNWSDLKELALAPSSESFEYRQPFIDKTNVHRCFFVEKFSGIDSYNRPFWTHSIPGSSYNDGLWREPVPFALSSEYGLAMTHHDDYTWLSFPGGVWRAALSTQSLDLTADVINIRQDVGELSGSLTIELRNDDGRYTLPGQDDLATLDIGSQLEFSPGFVTTSGNECSPGQSYSLEAYEHVSSGGKASLTLHTRDAWGALSNWKARQQFRWNKTTEEVSIKEILAYILARAGLRLELQSQSTILTGFCPDFTVSPGDTGITVIRRLLSFVPDVLFIEGNTAYIINPQSSDTPVYSYGNGHSIEEGRYRREAWMTNLVQVEGDDAGSIVLADSFAWEEIARYYDRLLQIEDKNISTVSEAQERGLTCLRNFEIIADDGWILVPVNCGQQLYDVIAVTDVMAGLDGEKKRVLGMTLVYHSERGEYNQRLRLGAL